jgi:hypothetical protein
VQPDQGTFIIFQIWDEILCSPPLCTLVEEPRASIALPYVCDSLALPPPGMLNGCPPQQLLLQDEIPKLIDINQTGFRRGRSIADTFVYALELVQVCHKRKRLAIVL